MARNRLAWLAGLSLAVAALWFFRLDYRDCRPTGCVVVHRYTGEVEFRRSRHVLEAEARRSAQSVEPAAYAWPARPESTGMLTDTGVTQSP